MLYSADSGVRRNTPAFGRLTPLSADGQVQRPDVEVGSAPLERLFVEERRQQPLHIGMELRHLGGGVSLANDEEVDLLGRRAVLEHRPHLSRLLPQRSPVDEARRRIHLSRPQWRETVVRLPALNGDDHRLARPGQPQGLVERAV